MRLLICLLTISIFSFSLDAAPCNTRAAINKAARGNHVAFFAIVDNEICSDFLIDSVYLYAHLQAKMVLALMHALHDFEHGTKRLNSLLAHNPYASKLIQIIEHLKAEGLSLRRESRYVQMRLLLLDPDFPRKQSNDASALLKMLFWLTTCGD